MEMVERSDRGKAGKENSSANGKVAGCAPNQAKWTFMVYMAGDNNLDEAAPPSILPANLDGKVSVSEKTQKADLTLKVGENA